jgi:hypothetical protein
MSENIQYRKELLKPSIKKFNRREVKTFYINDIWSADIADLSNISKFNDGYKYLLTIIDIYSRYTFVFPLKDKTSKSVLNCFKTIKQYPKNLWIDKGGEFLSKEFKSFCKEKDINIYHTYGESKAVFIERFNRTLKNRITQYMIENNTSKYINALDDIVDNYNNTIHSKTKLTPESIYKDGQEYENMVYEGLENKPKYKVGDYVRISRVKKTFEKGYTPNWTKEVFKIIGVDKRQEPVMYQLEDLLSEKIEGKFYEPELQKTNLKDYAKVEKVIKTKVVNGKKMYYVKFDGYDTKFNEWVENFTK